MKLTKNTDGTVTLTMTEEQADHLIHVADEQWDIYGDMGGDDVNDGDMSEDEIQAELGFYWSVSETLHELKDIGECLSR